MAKIFNIIQIFVLLIILLYGGLGERNYAFLTLTILWGSLTFLLLSLKKKKIISNPLKELTEEQMAEMGRFPAARRSGDIHRQSSTDGKETSDRIWKIKHS